MALLITEGFDTFDLSLIIINLHNILCESNNLSIPSSSKMYFSNYGLTNPEYSVFILSKNLFFNVFSLKIKCELYTSVNKHAVSNGFNLKKTT